jgi:hypothetical protein
MLRGNVCPPPLGEVPMASPVLCHLCQQPVMLESARINELGKAVHEDCYVRALQIGKSTSSQNSPTPDTTA